MTMRLLYLTTEAACMYNMVYMERIDGTPMLGENISGVCEQ